MAALDRFYCNVFKLSFLTISGGDNLHRYGELILHCSVNITHSIRECGNGLVLKYVCALLNSGGGILHMRNMDLEVWFLYFSCDM